jgi:hypothetical protein
MTHAKAFAWAAVVAGSLGWVGGAQAAPLSPAPLGATSPVERVAGGCGPGFHPNPWGICRPNLYGPRPYWGRPVYGGPYGYYRPRPVYRPYGYGPRPFYGPPRPFY